MEQVLKIAEKVADQAEIFFLENNSTSLTFQNNRPTDVKGSIQTGYALRLIKDGRIGTSYTRNLIDRDELVKNALASLVGEVKADFSFPEKRPIQKIGQYDSAIENIGFPELMKMNRELMEFFEGKVEGQANCYSGTSITSRKIMNSSGVDYQEKYSDLYLVPDLVFPKTRTSMMDLFVTMGPKTFEESRAMELLDMYTKALPEIDTGSRKMKIMMMPQAFTGFEWRINAAANIKRFLNKSSPLTDKVGQQVMSEKITIYNDPLDKTHPGAIGFDDEGVPTRKLDIIKNGIFQGTFNDLAYAKKSGAEPTGTGLRHEMWGEDDVAIPPSPYLNHLRIEPGNMSFEQMLAQMDEGIIAINAMGVHSGNILNGDISMGLIPGLYVKDGEIMGRAKDAMVAGNMYQMFSNVIGVENRIHKEHGIPLPCVLLDDVSVSGK